MVQKDYYSEWARVKPRTNLYFREKKAFELIKKISKPGDKVLDLGCGNGLFLKNLQGRFPRLDINGMDFSQEEVKIAKSRGLNVRQGDLSKKLPYKDGKFDIVYGAEIIEHLFDPDFLLSEANRILKDGGYLILTTPNLCAWFNRILVPLGIQPVFMETSTKSKKIGAGIMKFLKKESLPVGHVRIFNIDAIKDIIKSEGFSVLDIKGGIYDSYFPKSLQMVDRLFSLFPSIASGFIILSRKRLSSKSLKTFKKKKLNLKQ